MYKIIGDPLNRVKARLVELECSCGYKTFGGVIGTKEKGYTPAAFECRKCSDIRKKSLLKHRLNNFIIDTKTNCYNWLGSKTQRGHSQISINGLTVKVYKYLWEQANGLISKGLVIRHKCDNPSCINLDHLEIGTYKDNYNDRKRLV